MSETVPYMTVHRHVQNVSQDCIDLARGRLLGYEGQDQRQ